MWVPGAGLDDPGESLPAQHILWFCDLSGFILPCVHVVVCLQQGMSKGALDFCLDVASQTTAPSAFIGTPALSQGPFTTEPPTLPILSLCRAGITLLATSQGCCEESVLLFEEKCSFNVQYLCFETPQVLSRTTVLELFLI